MTATVESNTTHRILWRGPGWYANRVVVPSGKTVNDAVVVWEMIADRDHRKAPGLELEIAAGLRSLDKPEWVTVKDLRQYDEVLRVGPDGQVCDRATRRAKTQA